MMNKGIGTVLTLFAVLPIHALDDYRCTDKSLCEVHAYKEATSIKDAFVQGQVEGQIRLGYVDQQNDADGVPNTYATSLGGQLKFETAKFYNISIAASAFVSEKINDLSGNGDKLNRDFFGDDGNSFAYMGEAYINYAYKNFDLRVGRQKIDTPLNDRDDIRMLPNTFEAVMAGYGGIEDTVLVAGYIQRWAGYDSGGEISKFKDIGFGTNGVYLAGIMNESIQDTALQAWYYDIDKTAGVTYIDAVYAKEYDSAISAEAAVQYGNYNEKSLSDIEGDIYGAALALGYSGISIFGAFNETESSDGKSILLGFGGGPYFTSMEEMTVDRINDASAYVLGTEIDFSKLIDGLSLTYVYGKFDGDAGATKIIENDIILAYAFDESADIEISYATLEDKVNVGADDTGYDRFLVRANYNF